MIILPCKSNIAVFFCILHCQGLCYLSALIFYSALHVVQGAVMSLKVHHANHSFNKMLVFAALVIRLL